MPPKECWAIARLQKRQTAQSAERNLARQWPIRRDVPSCQKVKHQDDNGLATEVAEFSDDAAARTRPPPCSNHQILLSFNY